MHWCYLDYATRDVQKVLQLDNKEEWKCYKLHFDHMTATDHVAALLASSSKLLYALRVLRANGLLQQSLMDVFRATVESTTIHGTCMARICTARDRNRLNA